MPVETQERTEQQEPDIKGLIESRNQREEAARSGKVVEIQKPAPEKPADKPEEKGGKKPEATAEGEEEAQHNAPRWLRRENNRLREEAAYERGRREALEAQLQHKPAETAKPAAVADDPEPQRKDFADDAQYNRALGRWEARQEALKVVNKKEQTDQAKQQQQAFAEHVQEMSRKADEDKKNFADWDAVSEQALEHGTVVNWDENPVLMALIAQSDQKAALLYHFAKNDAELVKFLEMKGEPNRLIGAFHRLEGRIEKLYEKPSEPEKGGKVASEPEKGGKETSKTAAGAGKETSKDRIPEKAEQARDPRTTAAERDAKLPRPSGEVAARGGSPAPDEPEPGSAAWMAKRNAEKATSRY